MVLVGLDHLHEFGREAGPPLLLPSLLPIYNKLLVVPQFVADAPPAEGYRNADGEAEHSEEREPRFGSSGHLGSSDGLDFHSKSSIARRMDIEGPPEISSSRPAYHQAYRRNSTGIMAAEVSACLVPGQLRRSGSFVPPENVHRNVRVLRLTE